jgi:glycosyltransferase involved in cell wall biosynthesis
VPENNIHLLLEAFSKQSIFELAIIGNWESSAYGRKIRSKYIHQQHFHLLDPEYDITLLNQLRSNATIYLHGHSAGGTNPSLVEAMWLRVPIIAYDVIYNRVTTNNQAFYFANSVELVQLLKFADSQQLVDSAAYLEDFAHSHYCWTRVAAHYAALVEGNSVATIPVFEFDIPINLRKQLDHF